MSVSDSDSDSDSDSTFDLTRLLDMTPLELEVFKLIEEMLAQKALMSSSTLQLGVRGCAQAHRHAGYANAPASPTACLTTRSNVVRSTRAQVRARPQD